MVLDTKDEIRQYLVLQAKSTLDLSVLCDGMGLESDGTKEVLIKRLLSLGLVQQNNTISPQLIALRTKFNNQVIPNAYSFVERIRKLIDKNNQYKEFTVLNASAETYKQKLRYVAVSEETLKFLLFSDIIYPLASQRDLLIQMKKDYTKFLFHLVNKTLSDKSFIMLHCQPIRI